MGALTISCLDLTRQAGFIVTIYDKDGPRLATTPPLATPAEAFAEARKIVDNKVEGPKKTRATQPNQTGARAWGDG